MKGRADCKFCEGEGFVCESHHVADKCNRVTPCECNPAKLVEWDELFASNFDAWLGCAIDVHKASNTAEPPAKRKVQ